jgi:hypothetical protein
VDGINQGNIANPKIIWQCWHIEGTPLTSVDGDVYELLMEDVKKIMAMPGQISSIICLTNPYN